MLDALVDTLAREAGPVRVVETHISAVLLTAQRAYKLKKPVNLGFLDFTRLRQRRHFCREELRLNRRLAPELYLSVMPITGTVAAPRPGGSGRAIDWAVEMRRFPPEASLDCLLAGGHLEGAHIDALAECIAAFHRRLPPAPVGSPYGRPGDLVQAARDNFTALRDGASPRSRARLDRLAAWTEAEYRRRRALLVRRRIDGRVRECHGDLHLGNIVWLDGHPVPFDAIEFDPALRWQDVHGELAFLTMDLARRGRPDLARRVRDRYLQATGDYGGVPLVDFFEVYRALVRAKVARLRAAGAQAPGLRFQALRECIGCLRLAETLIRPRQPWLAITHGLAGSGKTHYADWLAERLPLIRLRSDVERKRLLGLGPGARTGSGIDQGAYRAKLSAATYRHLARLARRLLRAGWPVLVDASFLAAGERRRFARLAASLAVPFRILACSAPPDVLRERVERRAAQAGDASEANLAVLDAQRARYRPLGADEQALAIVIDTSRPYAVPAELPFDCRPAESAPPRQGS
ncbi:MAG: AAA family ATPase [Immundisolibacter sp.]|uniref:bifunctional aminoglycoside phosphotransferase/ATP-binding protein n=1 Tax=Immundisolibacter sp. TaxID=1934948 RepID=UPI0019C02F32|nr:bifunctional aminoglycoside phosphotransferase/ATP-binding protein [Immundisolibacter sp.]MBC7162491.1 AAA family ATPase [Immundisolibacter sp.]